MNSRRYVICDIEATGLHEDKEIIEIALVTIQDGKIIDVYETLVNPLGKISNFIQDLTSISSRDLLEAPKFYDVAESLWMRLEDAIFVSHRTDFDFNLLQKKFHELGKDLKLKTYCTLKVAQAEIPGLRSYSLDSLCQFFNIKNKDRHRALGDALATLELFKILNQLTEKVYPKKLYLPQHEKALSNLSSRSGLIYFKDSLGKVFKLEAAVNMNKRARELLLVTRENKDFLMRVESFFGEVTGSPLIAEFKRLNFHPFRPEWCINIKLQFSGEKTFSIRPHKKGMKGLWYFDDLSGARKKMKFLLSQISTEKYVYREGLPSKEEILKHNQQVENLVKTAKFPLDDLIIFGEGRSLGEKSLILIRSGHVLGYGFTDASQESILKEPEHYLQRRFCKHLGADQVAMRYIRELKNMRQKTDIWQGLSVGL